MTKSEKEFTTITEPTMQVASVGIEWFRQIAEHNISKGKVSLEELFKAHRMVVDAYGNQAAAIYSQSMSLANETVSNTIDCGVRLLRLREPQELAEVQSDFVSRQAQAFVNQSKELNQRFTRGAEALASSPAKSVGRPAKAA